MAISSAAVSSSSIRCGNLSDLSTLHGPIDRENADQRTRRITDRAGHGEEPLLELVVENGVTLLADLVHLLQEFVAIGDGVRRVGLKRLGQRLRIRSSLSSASKTFPVALAWSG